MCANIFIYCKFSQTPENNGQIQPQVVLCCKHNVTMRIYTKIQSILESNLDFQGFINITPTHPNPEVQPMVEFRVSFIRVTKRRQMFLQPDIFSHTPENNGHIQPQVVLLCEHNTIMRIQNKIQLILESNLDFQGFINIIQTHPEIQPAVEFGLRFLILVTL